MIYYVYDGEEIHKELTYEGAELAMIEALNYAKENCDPEWPSTTENISVFQCPVQTDDPQMNGTRIMYLEAIEEKDLESSRYYGEPMQFVDYVIRKVSK